MDRREEAVGQGSQRDAERCRAEKGKESTELATQENPTSFFDQMQDSITDLQRQRAAESEATRKQESQSAEEEPSDNFRGVFGDIQLSQISTNIKPGEFGDVKPLEKANQGEVSIRPGTRVPGQRRSETDEERRQREEEKVEAEIIESMHPQDRAKYNDPDTSEERRNTIFETYKDKLEERKRHEEADFRRQLDRTVKAQDLLRRIKGDPSKIDVPLPADESKEALLAWYNEMSQPKRYLPFPGSADAGARPNQPQRIPEQIPDNAIDKAKAQADPKSERTSSKVDLQGLRDAVERSNKVMGEAAEILLRKKPKPSAKTPSTVKTVWGFIRKFAAFGGTFLLGASWTMLQIDEYGFALILLLLGLGGLSIQIYDWDGIEGHSRATSLLKSVAAVLILFSLVYFSAVIVKRRHGKPWSNLLAQERRNETPTGKVQIKDGETVTARVKQWGTSGEHDAFVIVNSIELAPLADDYRLLIVCRAQDNKLDNREDPRIDKSAMFTIRGGEQKLEVALSQDTMRRLVPQGFINIYVLLVPAKVNAKELRTIKEFTQNGAHVLGNPSMLVNATIENKSGRLVGN